MSTTRDWRSYQRLREHIGGPEGRGAPERTGARSGALWTLLKNARMTASLRVILEPRNRLRERSSRVESRKEASVRPGVFGICA